MATLSAALIVAGAASGALDAAVNTQVARIEEQSKCRLMPLAHALYSVGVVVGAVGAGIAREVGAPRESIMLAVAAVLAAVAVVNAIPGTGPRTWPKETVDRAQTLTFRTRPGDGPPGPVAGAVYQ